MVGTVEGIAGEIVDIVSRRAMYICNLDSMQVGDYWNKIDFVSILPSPAIQDDLQQRQRVETRRLELDQWMLSGLGLKKDLEKTSLG